MLFIYLTIRNQKIRKVSEIKQALLGGIIFGVILSIVNLIVYDINTAIFIGIISGLLFGVIMYLFMNSGAVKRQTSIETLEGETVILSAGANHFKGMEAVGGKLYLLNNGLHFQSHKFNLQNHSLAIALDEIQKVDFFNNMGIIPNGLLVMTLDGKQEKFVIQHRKSWKEEIEKLLINR